MIVNYKSELERLQKGASNYFKPEAGQYKLKILSEIEQSEPFIRQRSGGTTEEQAQFKLLVLVGGEEKIWTFGYGQTLASTYGQLVDLASKHNDSLVNVEFTLAVKSDGKKKDFTIVA